MSDKNILNNNTYLKLWLNIIKTQNDNLENVGSYSQYYRYTKTKQIHFSKLQKSENKKHYFRNIVSFKGAHNGGGEVAISPLEIFNCIYLLVC